MPALISCATVASRIANKNRFSAPLQWVAKVIEQLECFVSPSRQVLALHGPALVRIYKGLIGRIESAANECMAAVGSLSDHAFCSGAVAFCKSGKERKCGCMNASPLRSTERRCTTRETGFHHVQLWCGSELTTQAWGKTLAFCTLQERLRLVIYLTEWVGLQTPKRQPSKKDPDCL